MDKCPLCQLHCQERNLFDHYLKHHETHLLHLAKKGTKNFKPKKISPSTLRNFRRKRKGIAEIEKNLSKLKTKDVDLDEIDFTLPWLGLSKQTKKDPLISQNIVHERKVPALKVIEIHTII